MLRFSLWSAGPKDCADPPPTCPAVTAEAGRVAWRCRDTTGQPYDASVESPVDTVCTQRSDREMENVCLA